MKNLQMKLPLLRVKYVRSEELLYGHNFHEINSYKNIHDFHTIALIRRIFTFARCKNRPLNFIKIILVNITNFTFKILTVILDWHFHT